MDGVVAPRIVELFRRKVFPQGNRAKTLRFTKKVPGLILTEQLSGARRESELLITVRKLEIISGVVTAKVIWVPDLVASNKVDIGLRRARLNFVVTRVPAAEWPLRDKRLEPFFPGPNCQAVQQTAGQHGWYAFDRGETIRV